MIDEDVKELEEQHKAIVEAAKAKYMFLAPAALDFIASQAAIHPDDIFLNPKVLERELISWKLDNEGILELARELITIPHEHIQDAIIGIYQLGAYWSSKGLGPDQSPPRSNRIIGMKEFSISCRMVKTFYNKETSNG